MPGALKLVEHARTAANEIDQRVLTQLRRARADPAHVEYWTKVQQALNSIVTADPVAGQQLLRLISGVDSMRGAIDRIATTIESLNKLGR